MKADTLYLSQADVKALLTPELAVSAVKSALRCHAKGDYDQPPKPYVRPLGREREAEGGRFITMPAYLGPPFHCAGVKWIAGFPENIKRNQPRASGLIILSDADTGAPVAVMDCAFLSAMRTGAVASICAELLGPSDACNIAVMGAGPVAQATINSLAYNTHRIDTISIYDLCYERAQELCSSLSSSTDLPMRFINNAKECVSKANIIVTATTTKTSYLHRDWLESCRLIVALSFEDCGEDIFLSADKVVVDDFDQCNREEKLIHRLVRSGRFSRERVYAELGQIVAGHKPGREHPGELIYVNPMGMAIEDIAVASEVYHAALAQGRGTKLTT